MSTNYYKKIKFEEVVTVIANQKSFAPRTLKSMILLFWS